MSDFNKWAKKLCALEGLKEQVNIAQMSEVLAKVCNLFATEPGFVAFVYSEAFHKRMVELSATYKKKARAQRLKGWRRKS